MSHAAIVNAWFQEKIATGEIARHTPAYNQAFAAKADLIARLDGVSAKDEPAPATKGRKSHKPEPAASAASEE